jgi:hypothetical protein
LAFAMDLPGLGLAKRGSLSNEILRASVDTLP